MIQSRANTNFFSTGRNNLSRTEKTAAIFVLLSSRVNLAGGSSRVGSLTCARAWKTGTSHLNWVVAARIEHTKKGASSLFARY